METNVQEGATVQIDIIVILSTENALVIHAKMVGSEKLVIDVGVISKDLNNNNVPKNSLILPLLNKSTNEKYFSPKVTLLV